MTPKQLKFAEGVAAGKTQKAAYLNAGYKGIGHTAEVNASNLLKNPEIQNHIALIQSRALQQAVVRAGEVISYLTRVLIEGTEEARKSNGTRFVRPVGTAHRIRAAELLGRAFKLWIDGPTQPDKPQGIDLSKLTDADLEELERIAERATGAHVDAAPLVVIHPATGAHVGAALYSP